MNTNVVKMDSRPALDFDAPPITTSAVVLDMTAIESISRVAEIMAAGKATIPRHLQGNRGDCFAVTMQAMQWGMNPFAVAQKTHLVSGTLGYEAQLVNAVITARAPVTGRINYEWFGEWDRIAGRFKEVPSKNNPDEKRIVRDWTIKDEEGLGVRVWATFKGESEPRELRLLLAQAGVRNSPLWGQDPKQQLAYLAVKRWSRLYCPDVILGVYTPDELEERAPRDMGRAEEVGQTPSNSRTDAVRSKLASKRAAPAPTANLDKILRDIESATSGHELKKAIEPAANLASEADKEKVRDAYQAKLNAERERQHREAAAQAHQDQPGAEGEAPTLTYDELIARFNATTDVDVLDADATLIGQLPEDKQQAALDAYNDRREVLLGA
ncbi:recombinase RecT [Burkholderia vietnamiensis]|uniref:Recombinase RecT n=1 Tax=Burkholderia vietnamiensis TaxID=60552 RepID=A0AAW7T2S7_BURVI|nr:recombinase RecT [Burkholderia vietnamiensis]MDN7795879.1 recombinase RecT [Burkholderia vietnamiensis]